MSCKITKEIKIKNNGPIKDIVYTIENHSNYICNVQFDVEFNSSITAGGVFGRYYYIKNREIIGNWLSNENLIHKTNCGLWMNG